LRVTAQFSFPGCVPFAVNPLIPRFRYLLVQVKDSKEGNVPKEQRSELRGIWSACLALVLLLLGASVAQAQDCVAPPSWSEADARQSGPEAAVEACLKAQAWQIRNRNIPTESAVGGIVSQCEVRVTFAAGPVGSASRTRVQQLLDANDGVALGEAAGDVTWARRCAGR